MSMSSQASSTMSSKYNFFWRKGSPFSQWHSSTYTLDGYQYSSAEQGMMHGKALLFGDEEMAAQILQTHDPKTIKKLGRYVKGFSDKEWKKHREDIVYRNNVAKFTQNGHLREALMNTTGLLVEASPSDKIWGIGMHEDEARQIPESKWKGLNLLGKILTNVRETLRSDEIRPDAGKTTKEDGEEESQPSKSLPPPGVKTIYMIRHGQSEGQIATRRDRKRKSELRDCDLTRKGRSQASAVAAFFSDIEEYRPIQLVVSSPLTRALHTSLLAFPRHNIIVNYDLGELGGSGGLIPENTPRKVKDVLKDLRRTVDGRDEDVALDTTSLQPVGWPNNDEPTNENRIQNAMRWLAEKRDESVVAVVCHYNVIREAVTEGNHLSPSNAVPIRCQLYPNGKVVLAP